jgi:hypothetical protein
LEAAIGYLTAALVALPAGVVGTIALVAGGLRWTWALLVALLALLATLVAARPATVCVLLAALLASQVGRRYRAGRLLEGGESARAARSEIGVAEGLAPLLGRLFPRRDGADDAGPPVAHDDRGRPLKLRVGLAAGVLGFILGAADSGKTTAMKQAIRINVAAGLGAFVFDGKGASELRDWLAELARRTGQRLVVWTPDGGAWFNPLVYGTYTEKAELLLATQRFTEPHYQTMYQRCLINVMHCLEESLERAPTLADVIALIDADELTRAARSMRDQVARAEVLSYAARMTAEERRALRGLENRLAVLIEAGPGHFLLPPADGAAGEELDVAVAVAEGAIVYVALDSSRFPELARQLGTLMLGALRAYAGQVEAGVFERRPFLVAVDEFSAIGADVVAALYARGRSALSSLLLVTQELADLEAVGAHLRDQIVGNLTWLLGLRQNVPESAAWLSDVAGSEETWEHVFHSSERRWGALGPPAGEGRVSSRRGRRPRVEPDEFKELRKGQGFLIEKDPLKVVRVAIVDAEAGEGAPGGGGA